MKKFVCFIFALIISITSVMCCFSTQKTESTFAVDFIEDTILNKSDILSENTSSVASCSSVRNNAPLNKATGKMLTGYTHTPSKNNAGEQKAKFTIQTFKVTEGQSVYMWLYFAETLPYDLTITFSNNDFSIYWYFNNGQVLNFMDNNGVKAVPYGWRLFEFVLAEAQTSDESVEVLGTEFTTMTFSYETSVEITTSVTCEGMSLYHVFLGDSYGNTTGVVYYQNFANFEISADFNSKLQGIYINDEIKINGVYDIFEYVVIGKYDLKNYSKLDDYTWSIVIRDADAKKITFDFGDTYTFEKKGWYSLNIKLTKIDGLTDEVVLNASYSLYCEEFGIGSFTKKNYYLETGTKNVLTFKASPNFVFDEEISISVSDKNIAEVVNYTNEGGTYYVTISARETGNVKLTIKASGHRNGYSETETYTCETTVYVNNADSYSGSIVLLWVIFGAFCVVLVSFIVISFVKARKFGVK